MYFLLACADDTGTVGEANESNNCMTSNGVVVVVGAPDTDLDGCSDQKELGSDPFDGGMRDPSNFWDFYDTRTVSNVTDRAVTAADVFGLLSRFGATGTAVSAEDAQSPPAPPPAYHASYDRGPVPPGQDPWDLTAPNGSISSSDIFALLVQFGHNCT
jgi:hypothetical protein